MAGSPFEGVKGDSDLDAAADPNAKEKLERHWDTFIQEHDWQWIKNHGFNTIRLPVRLP